MSEIFAKLPDALLDWYEKNKRQLPWREDRDPYHIWLSEIMLQQTRVEAVKGYYTRFISALPTMKALSQADDELLNKLWEGLGYYSRVRNLKKAAGVIMEQHGGMFPADYKKVLALPGIGPYTAGAICSIAFDLPTPAVDGNVLRLITRLTDDPTPIDTPAFKKQVQDRLQAVYPVPAGEFTQALMELGATVCGPNRKPDCKNCPCKGFCFGYQRGTAEKLPVKLPRKIRKKEDRTVFVLSCNGAYALQKRGAEGLLANLWQFPNVSGKLDLDKSLLQVEEMGLSVQEILWTVERKHIFTHIEWDMRGVYVEIKEPSGGFTWLTREEMNAQTALPTAFRQFLDVAEEL